MSNSSVLTVDADGIRYNPNFTTEPNSLLFDPKNTHLAAQPVTQGGRNAAWFIEYQGQQAVLRHYRRGGLIAKLIRQYYFWMGAEQTRSWAEYAVLLHLSNAGVAVPAPLAAWWQRVFLGYKAAIIVARIPEAFPIAHQLDQCDPKAVAFAVKQMHDAGVWHADLNVFNVLMDTQKRIYLIDFDRAKIRDVVDAKQRKNNLLRLRRSLIKVRGLDGQQWYEQFALAYQRLIKT